MGSGEKVKVSISIELECYNTPEAINSALDIASFNSFQNINNGESFSGYDDVMDCRYRVKRTVKKL